MSILYPDVPIAAGVPVVLRHIAVDQITTLLSKDDDSLPVDDTPAWGVFDSDGFQVLFPDSVVSVEYTKEEQISTFPVEEGGFQSYNKVETPYSARMIVTKSGSIEDRMAFLEGCDKLRASTDLFTIFTAETIYYNANVTRSSQTRSGQSGAQMISVELAIEEVRQSATSKFTDSKTQSPASAGVIDNGSVQTATPANTPKGQPS